MTTTTTTKETIYCVADWENDSPWWDSFHRWCKANGFDSYANAWAFTKEQWEELQNLPGWGEGPKYAKTPLLEITQEDYEALF